MKINFKIMIFFFFVFSFQSMKFKIEEKTNNEFPKINKKIIKITKRKKFTKEKKNLKIFDFMEKNKDKVIKLKDHFKNKIDKLKTIKKISNLNEILPRNVELL